MEQPARQAKPDTRPLSHRLFERIAGRNPEAVIGRYPLNLSNG